MNEGPSSPSPVGDPQTLAAALAPALRAACGGRLGEIEWFRSTWQRGGAATGFAQWTDSNGHAIPVVVKLPVGPREHRWALLLGAVDAGSMLGEGDARPVPRVVAGGDSLGGYDLGWLVMERLEGHTLAHSIDRSTIEDLLRTAARFHALAAQVRPVEGQPPERDWGTLIGRSREVLRAHEVEIGDHQRWNEALKKVQRALPMLEALWRARPLDTWCHGDLHPGNAMRRPDDDGGAGPCVLLDLAFVHLGCWVEDAVYLERQFWGHEDRLEGIKPVSMLAKCRRELGLRTDGEYALLASVRRILMAACVPGVAGQEGSPAYASAALGIIERVLPQITR
ncbi:MAG: aminoglycoside phosphotransferase family protein [Phycisphaeraceae bacterium]|nr:aminoglycoside phosphotransferase family protein [Phycisphaeraceae bacterium]